MGKFYAVQKGRQPGVYLSWDECKAQVDGFSGPVFKKFSTLEEAQVFCASCGMGPSSRKQEAKISSIAKADPGSSYREDAAEYIIFTDGSCLRNPSGPGGYAAVILRAGEVVQELYGCEASTTNNRMEMMAAIRALEFLDHPMRVVLYTDSQYLLNGFVKKWVNGWKKRNWMTSKGTPVLNPELWKRLDMLTQVHHVTWKWLRGHRGQQYNERCDTLAKMAALKQIGNA